MSNLNEMQGVRLALAKEVNFDVEKAKKVWDFVVGENEHLSCVEKHNVKTVCTDGIYYIQDTGFPIHESQFSEDVAKHCIGVGIVKGDKFASVALHDIADGDEIALKADNDAPESDGPFYSDFWDAMYDWDGRGNTERMKKWLNPAIQLKEGEYIPSVAELHLILMNIKDINRALENVGGTPLQDNCYWSSTEYSSGYSWYVIFSSGGTWSNTKYYSYTVRPSVAYKA